MRAVRYSGICRVSISTQAECPKRVESRPPSRVSSVRFSQLAAPSAAARRLGLAREGQAIDRSNFGCGQPLELADLGLDARHDLPRYGDCRLGRSAIGNVDSGDQVLKRVVQPCRIAQYVALRLAMDVHQYGFDLR